MCIDPDHTGVAVCLACRKHSQDKLVGRTPRHGACRRYQVPVAHRILATDRRNQIPAAEILIKFESNLRTGKITMQHVLNVKAEDERLVALACGRDSVERALDMNEIGRRTSSRG